MGDSTIENFWNRILNPDSNKTSDEVSSWEEEIQFLYKMGISMEDTVRYLHYEKPSFPAFKDWIHNRKDLTKREEQPAPKKLLSKEDLAFWDKNGYIVIKNAVSKSDCEAAQNAIWEFLGANPNDKQSWYRQHEEKRGMMVNFTNHPALKKNRESIIIQRVYGQLYKTNSIYKTIDKVSFNPPVTQDNPFMGSSLHWDVSLKLPIPFKLQGLLYLSDCHADDGAFHCVPGFHKTIDSWMNTVPSNENPRETALKTLQPVPITGQAGDFIIWHQALPHCATPNKGKLPRMVQYLTYYPEEEEKTAEWI